MAGSSRDHERGAHLPDELSDILRSLSERQTNILYYALTNQHVRGYFLDLLQNRVTEIAENHTRAAAGHLFIRNSYSSKQADAEAAPSSFEDNYSSCSLQTSKLQCHVAPQRCELHRSTSATATTINTCS